MGQVLERKRVKCAESCTKSEKFIPQKKPEEHYNRSTNIKPRKRNHAETYTGNDAYTRIRNKTKRKTEITKLQILQ